MPAIALGPLHLQSCMSQFLLENPPMPLHSPGHFYDLHWAVITSSHALFSPDWGPWGTVCIWFVSGYPIKAALLRQSLKVMVPSEELTGGKADGESSFFISSPGRAVTPFPLTLPRELALTLEQSQPVPPLENAVISHSLVTSWVPVSGSRGGAASLPSSGRVYGLGVGTGPNDLLTVFWKWGSRMSIWLDCHCVGMGQGHQAEQRTQYKSCVGCGCLDETEAREQRLPRGQNQAGLACRLPCERLGHSVEQGHVLGHHLLFNRFLVLRA